MINYHADKNITVLDFFAGSGTTGHAVMQLNKEDGGHRKYILALIMRMIFVKKSHIKDLKIFKGIYHII